MLSQIDHLVIAASSLQQGLDYVKAQLGVDMPFGGVHTQMGTHNHLLQLGDQLFLEVIAINPGHPPLTQPRWFGLDDPQVRQRLSDQAGLITWVVNTSDITGLIRQNEFNFGRVTQISRGELHWLFGLPDDGRLLAGGLLPYLMQWQCDTHPAAKMHDAACRLESLTLYHPRAEWIGDILAAIGILPQVNLQPLPDDQSPFLQANIRTPAGRRTLSSRVNTG